jgi:hypothetical protein
MPMLRGIAFFKRHQRLLMVLSAAYVGFLILLHIQYGAMHVWLIACVFSIIMNITYVFEAYAQKAYGKPETSVACVLIVLSLMGVLINPVFVIIAIFGHGSWVMGHFKTLRRGYTVYQLVHIGV